MIFENKKGGNDWVGKEWGGYFLRGKLNGGGGFMPVTLASEIRAVIVNKFSNI